MAYRQRLRVLGVGLALVVAGCGSDGSDRATPPTSAAGAGKEATSTAASGQPRCAAPRWETVATYSGRGPFETPELTILRQSDPEPGNRCRRIQWRVRYHCEAGRLRVDGTPPPQPPGPERPRRAGGTGPLVDSECPKDGEAFSIQAAPARLLIDAAGPWTAIVDQQVDTPLDEPLPSEAASAPVLAQGSFYRVEKDGKGTARIYQLADGRRMLRFEDFEVSQNTDLFVWLTEALEPKTTVEVVDAPHVDIGTLKSTVGTQNYELPADLPTDRVRSVVIWCEPVRVAYIAAPLLPA